MSIQKSILTLLCCIILVVSCEQPRLNFDRSVIQETPFNLAGINSEWDDFNSAGIQDMVSGTYILLFSSNRASKGEDFNFENYYFSLYSNLVTGELLYRPVAFSDTVFQSINTGYNEFGPWFNSDFELRNYNFDGDSAVRLYFTCDSAGSMDLYFSDLTARQNGESFSRDGEVKPLAGLNTGFHEGYVSLHRSSPKITEDLFQILYFMTDRDGQFDIYKAECLHKGEITDTSSFSVEKDATLNSGYNDKTPLVFENTMVFASDRPGGFGGYDLYYSVYENGRWQEPVNFGDKVNTEFNEYRPCIFKTRREDFMNNFMLFSSDRPGGLGGYDLFLAGLPVF